MTVSLFGHNTQSVMMITSVFQIPDLASAKLDCLVDLDTGKTVKLSTRKAIAAFEECDEDKRLSDYIGSAIQLDEFGDDSAWLGSNGFVSSAFEMYLEALTKSMAAVMKACKYQPSDTTTTTELTTTASTSTSYPNTDSKLDLFRLTFKGMLDKVVDFSLHKAPFLQMTWWRRSMKSEDEKKPTYYGRKDTTEERVSVRRTRQFGSKWISTWIETDSFSIWCSMHYLDLENSNNTNVNPCPSLLQATVARRKSSVFAIEDGSSNAHVMTYPNGDVYEVSDMLLIK